MDKPFLGFIIIFLLVLANAFFVAAGHALAKARAMPIDMRGHNGIRAAALTRHFHSHADSYRLATQIGITLASLSLGWLGGPFIAKALHTSLAALGVPVAPRLTFSATIVVAFVLLAGIHAIFGTLVPQIFVSQRPDAAVRVVAFPLRLFATVLSPAIAGLKWGVRQVIRTIGIEPSGAPSYLKAGFHSQGGPEDVDSTITATEQELLEKVFAFGEKVVKEVMVSRSHIVALNIAAPSDAWFKVVEDEGYTRMPVYQDSLDNILGIVHTKDLIMLFEHAELIVPHDLLRPAYFVPEAKPISKLLREFQLRKLHLAIVVDEFGGTVGLVTMEDILEELVGEIQDEHDDEPVDVEKINDSTYIVNASLTIADVNNSIHGCQLPEGPDYTTLSGFVNKWFGHIPEANESFELDAFRLTVLKTANHHVAQVKIEALGNDPHEQSRNMEEA